MKKKLLFLICCFLLLFITGCGKVPKLENGQELIVELNNINITVDDLYEQMKNRYARDILIDMIDTAILNIEYETDEELKSHINTNIDYIKEQTGDYFLEAIKFEWGLNSEQELYKYLELNLKRNLAVKDYVKSLISDNEISNYYNKEIVGDILVSHILIKPQVSSEMTKEEVEEEEEKALALTKDLINKLNEGANFQELAIEYSHDGTAVDGGSLGWFNKGMMVEPFERVAYLLDKDEYTKEPVVTQFGYHIILKEDIKDKPPLDEVKNNIIDILVEKKLSQDDTLYLKALSELRKEKNLIIHDTEINKQYNQYLKDIINK